MSAGSLASDMSSKVASVAAGVRLRITAQLIDEHSSTHIWSDHYAGGLADVFDLQDRILQMSMTPIAARARR